MNLYISERLGKLASVNVGIYLILNNIMKIQRGEDCHIL